MSSPGFKVPLSNTGKNSLVPLHPGAWSRAGRAKTNKVGYPSRQRPDLGKVDNDRQLDR